MPVHFPSDRELSNGHLFRVTLSVFFQFLVERILFLCRQAASPLQKVHK